MYTLLRFLMRAVVRTYLVGLFRVAGAENVPATGPFIVCPNHSGTLDPPLVPAFVPRSDSWSMAKSEYFEKPLNRWLFSRYHAFPVIRHSADRAALKRSFDLLKAGHVLIMYPEGTRVDTGVLSQAEPGAGFIAQKAACPVLPVALTGTPECLPKGASWPHRVPVTVTFGKPFVVRQRRPSGEKVSHEQASEAIMLAIAELLPADRRGVFSDLRSLHERLDGVTEAIQAGASPGPV
ncbi:MAG TPA: lysophospholipid acyltransferase family protein [Candidatus Dormibacteraeota bacterium]|nr:lysophospholipid acyltransferase family protein [Candidatus Dormibacteraeota bacterium]